MSIDYTFLDTFSSHADEFADGDAPAAAIINPLAEAAANNTLWLANRRGNGALRCVDIQALSIGPGNLGSSAAAAYGTGDAVIFGATMVAAANDVIEIECNFHISLTVGATQVEYRLAYQIAGAGAITGIANVIAGIQAAAAGEVPLHLSAYLVWPSATAVYLYIQQRVIGGPGTSSIWGEVSGVVKQWRVIP